ALFHRDLRRKRGSDSPQAYPGPVSPAQGEADAAQIPRDRVRPAGENRRVLAGGAAAGAGSILADETGGRKGMAGVLGQSVLLPGRIFRSFSVSETRKVARFVWRRTTEEQPVVLSGDVPQPVWGSGGAIIQSGVAAQGAGQGLAAHRGGEAVRPWPRVGDATEQRVDQV